MTSTSTTELKPFSLINLADGDDAKPPTKAYGLPTATQRLRSLAKKVNEIIEHVKSNKVLINATRSDMQSDHRFLKELMQRIMVLEKKGPVVQEGYYTGGRKTRRKKKHRRKTKRKRKRKRKRTRRR
jgi:hypothetical protein